LATPTQNTANVPARNKLNAKCVQLSKNGKYRVTVEVRGKRYNLGRFDDLDSAKEAYFAFAIKQYGEFARAA